MNKIRPNTDLTQIIFILIFIITMIIACFWIIKPFILGFAWAGMVVIATWPLMSKLQRLLWNKRSLAVIFMISLLMLLFIIPVFLLVNSLIDNSGNIIAWAKSGNINIPKLIWLKNLPMIGEKLFFNYCKLINGGGVSLVAKIQPYIGKTTNFFVAQVGNFGRFMLHLGIMLFFSILLYLRGEQVSQKIRDFAYRMAGMRGEATILLAGQTIRAVALGVIVTALIQGILGWIGLVISGIHYSTILTVLMIFCCFLQIGPLIVLIPIVIWLYWIGETSYGTILLIWSCIVSILDNVLRPILISIGANLPIVLIISGVIGGILAFGMIGIFIGPVILSISYRLVLSWITNPPQHKNIL